MSDESLNRRGAEKLANKKGFDENNVLFCNECGRTVVRTQKLGNPGYKDSVYCTCEPYGPPMFELNKDDD